MKVAIIGASNKPSRYSYMALMLLREKGHEVFPVHPKLNEIEGYKVYNSINDIEDDIDTITMYVSSDISSAISDRIIKKMPRRVIFNPGAENPDLEKKLKAKGIEVVNACTLVLLKTEQF